MSRILSFYVYVQNSKDHLGSFRSLFSEADTFSLPETSMFYNHISLNHKISQGETTYII